MASSLLDGQIVNYEMLGRGRPVIFLHSWIGSWRYWFPAMQVATKSFHAYALDMLGFGDSSTNPERYTIEQQSNLLNHFLDEMGIGKVAIIGHGLGALVGFNFCVRWTQSVDRIMAVNVPLRFESIHERMRTSSIPDLVNWLGSKTPEATTALADASKADPRAVTGSISSFQSDDLFAKMAQTQIACLLVYGGHDPAIQTPPEKFLQNLPDMMQPVIFEKSGHFPMFDEETRFNHLLMDFLLLDSGESPREMRV
jgi:pimeloyl-ACP methyl ester carboxylesterase